MDFFNSNISFWFIQYVEVFVRNELLRRLLEKSQSLKIQFEEDDKKHFFGEFVKDPVKFYFTECERSLLVTAAKVLEKQSTEISPSKKKRKVTTCRN